MGMCIIKDKHYNIKTCFKAIISFWFIILVSLTLYSNHKISRNVERQVGDRAIILATYIANTLELTDEDIVYLKSLSFEELLKSETNQKFEKNARTIMEISDYKCIYLASRLEEGDTNNSNNIIYILDAADNEGCYNENLRYDKANELFEEVNNTKISNYNFIKTKRGEYINAYAPFYTVEGNYIGLIGVEVSANIFKTIINNYMNIIILYIVINLVIGYIVFFLYKHMKNIYSELEEERIISGIDDLTRVFNRRKFNEISEKLWKDAKEKKEELSLILIDLDYFKEFNDNYGHVTGDALLKAMGSVLKRKAAALDGYTCRYGGDEFLILFPKLDLNQSEIVANEILKEVNNLKLSHEYSPIDRYQTVSIGVASTIPAEGMVIDDLLNEADNALYLSKKYGKNRVSIWNK
ncbi:GGDEF domain-containing protein [Tissierella sp. MB52-C2]|uniref:GGDEF domain-containing protein n=1 Tax=Tissierella sp. MB52-C2 TaxID=3070999 RepID=UPI00280A4FB1|nr:GGDEF domain-containing protein [Tissierella sp. MB52-C2]WMM24425.1 GGDEF domain-containing protein [Tissierella sp. MB52-C2]